MYDVIVVGTRVAVASTAMLLARRGLKVLAVDRAAFPSDTLSTHQVQGPGVARLARWGILDGVVAAGTPAAASVRFDPGQVVLRGSFREFEGASAVYSPRRTLLDKPSRGLRLRRRTNARGGWSRSAPSRRPGPRTVR